MEGIELDSESSGLAGKRFFEFASARMKGQDKAIRRLAKALDHAESPLRIRNRPICSVLVVGGAGSGKSYLPKLLAEFWFKNPDGLTNIPCSQFFKVSFSQSSFIQHDFNAKLKGENQAILAPYLKVVNEKAELEQKLQELKNLEDPNNEKEQEKIKADEHILEEKLSKKSEEFKKIYSDAEPILLNLRSILVLDHIEESNLNEIQEALSNVLERGMLGMHNSDSSWEISFVNSIIFITCNDCIPFEKSSQNDSSKIGFTSEVSKSSWNRGDGGNRYLRGMGELKDYFSSKFISRIDRVEILKEYSESALLEIVNLFFDEFEKWLKDNFPVMLIVEDEVKKFIVREGSDHPEFGIRLLKNKFDKYIRRKLELLEQKKLINKNEAIRVHMGKKDGKDIVVFTKLNIPQLPSK